MSLALIPLLFSLTGMFNYPHDRPLDVRVVSTSSNDGVTVLDVTYASVAAGKRTRAFVVVPPTPGPHPGILFVHWLGPVDSNRTQYLNEAVSLAKRGAESLLIDAMWAKPDWFETRRQEEDLKQSVLQVKELRRAMDVLLARPGIDPKRVAFVGHDFGAMCGAVMAGVDRRATVWALAAGTTSFSDWYLLKPKLEGAARERFIKELSVIDPTRYIGSAAPAPVLFQFSKNDPYVPQAKADDFFRAAAQPKEVRFYDAGHELNKQAADERDAWLCERLKMGAAEGN